MLQNHEICCRAIDTDRHKCTRSCFTKAIEFQSGAEAVKELLKDKQTYSITPKKQLTDAQMIAVQLTARGLNASECARKLSSKEYAQTLGPDYQINARSVSRWLKLPHVQAALLTCQEQRVSELRTYEAKHTSVMLPIARADLAELVPVAIEALRDVLKGDGGRSAASRVKAAEVVLRWNGVMTVKTTGAASEQTTSTQGLTEDTCEKLRRVLIGRVLFGEK